MFVSPVVHLRTQLYARSKLNSSSIVLLLSLDPSLGLRLCGFQGIRGNNRVLVIVLRGNPRHLELKVPILLIMDLVNNARCFDERLLAGGEIVLVSQEFLDLRLGGLAPLTIAFPWYLNTKPEGSMQKSDGFFVSVSTWPRRTDAPKGRIDP